MAHNLRLLNPHCFLSFFLVSSVMSSHHLTTFYFLFLRAWVASTSKLQHCLLRTIMTPLDMPLKGLCQFSLYDHDNFVSNARSDFYKAKCALEMGLFSNIFVNTDHNTQRYLLRNQSSLSHWLTTVPVMKDSFHLSANESSSGMLFVYVT